MKKLLAMGGIFFAAAAVISALSLGGATPAHATNQCTVEAQGSRDSAFKVANNTATVTFTAKGEAGCTVQVSANSFYAPSMNGQPYSKQILFDRTTVTVGKGTHTISVKLPSKSTEAKGCYYQVDLTYGIHNVTPVLAYGHGKVDCSTPKPPVPPKEKVEVCDLKTKKHVFVEQGYDKTRYTTDFSKCEDTTPPVTPPTTPPATPETPSTPAPETPAALPETGPVDSIAQFLGAGSMVASAGYYIQSRRRA